MRAWIRKRRSLCALSAGALLALSGPSFADSVSYTYDTLGRLKTVVYSSGKVVTYIYDAAGNRTRMVAQVGIGANHPPVAVADTRAGQAGVVLSIDALVNDTDVDNDPLEITSETSANAVISPDHRTIIYTPPGSPANETFSYSISDFRGGTASSTVTVTFGGHQLQMAHDTASTRSGVAVTKNVTANDIDPLGHTLSITAVTPAQSGTRTFTGTSITYTPSANFAGTETLTYTVSDSNGAVGQANLVVTVVANQAPYANVETIQVARGGSIVFSPFNGDGDADGDPITLVNISQAPQHGSATTLPNGYEIAYGRSSQSMTADTFKYTITDGKGAYAQGTINVEVFIVNSTPVANDDTIPVPHNTATNLDVLVNDQEFDDGDTKSVQSILSGPSSGAAVNHGSYIRYTPNTGFAGNDTLTYRMQDSHGATSDATATLVVAAAAPTIVANADTLTVISYYLLESNSWTTVGCMDAKANDTIPPGGASIVSVTQPGTGGTTFTNGTDVCFEAPGYMTGGNFSYLLQASVGGATSVGSVTVSPTP